MEFQVNKGSEFPIYQQLKEQIKYYLLSGTLSPGTRVPPPKDLASYLQINRNTVIAAYKELEKEGILVTKHGQGTYISDQLPSLPDGKRKQELISLAREALEKTIRLGFSAEDLFTVVFNQTVLGVNSLQKTEIKLALVECNLPDLNYFQQELEKNLDVKVEGLLLSELPKRSKDEIISSANIVVTTFPHIEDVKAILEPMNKEVVAIMAAPHLHTFMQIAQLPPGTRVGLICGTHEGASSMRRAIESAGINHISLKCSGFNNEECLLKMYDQVDLIVSSRVVFDVLKPLVPKDIEVIQYNNILDQAGLQMLKQVLEKLKTSLNHG